jgi:hypothetical protein
MTVHHSPVQSTTLPETSDVETYTINSMPTMITTGAVAGLALGAASGLGSIAVGAAGAAGSYVFNNGITSGIDYSVAGRSSLQVGGDANISGDIVINGKKLTSILDSIESRLAILHPNEQLEEQWENLRGLREAYMALEKEIIEKEKMWAKLKTKSIPLNK